MAALCATCALIVAGCGTKPAAGAHESAATWRGPALFSVLRRLPNYADSASILESDSEGEIAYAQDGAYTGSNYREDVTGQGKSQAFMGATSLIRADGNYYIDLSATPQNPGFQVGWYKIGSTVTGPYTLVMENFSQIATAWNARLVDSSARVTGSCSRLGRKGILWRVKFRIPQEAGLKPVAYGTACTDAKTGAPLSIDLSYRALDSAGNAVRYQDHFALTALGSVPEITAPAGAAPAPKISYSQ